ncbi:ComEC/Rec2 family competence protein [Pseudarthrobacter sp. NPDC092419]|uniref:ComEC/Rec2 family competence protein n=1 Tax=Pseudarthrobacter sp. NPDC092419 TaxID=3364414 RepID=UPI00382D9FA5
MRQWGRTEGSGQGPDGGPDGPRRRTDLRLVPAALLVWGASVAGLWLPASALAVLCFVMVVAAAWMIYRMGRRGLYTGSFLATGAVALLLAAATAAHSSAGAVHRFDGPVAEAAATRRTAVALVEVCGLPRALAGPGAAADRSAEERSGAGAAATPEPVPAGRWAVPVRTRELTAGGTLIRTRALLLVTGGGEWGAVVPGQVFRVTGTLRPADPGRPEAGVLAASSMMPLAGPGTGLQATVLQGAARDLRARFVTAAAFLPTDARGLLPGMVTGDTTALDSGLEGAMQLVGMTHLTAVSGANCSLVLGALLFACRWARLPRAPAAGAALAGLGLFVVLVGPDASVLRAALMGAVAATSLAGGRTGRGLSFLCLAVMGLLFANPALGSSFGFVLSVLATLGIILLGRGIVDGTPRWVPRWVAALVAVPLSAQLLCGPVIVLLQPQFATYSLLANVVAAPLVAPVTLLGTAAVPLVAVAPWPAALLIGVAGTFCGAVAAVARGAAGLPGASLPWPEGPAGMVTMMLLSAFMYGLLAAILRPAVMVGLAVRAHRRTERLLELVEHVLSAKDRSCGAGPKRGHGRLEYPTALSGRNPRWPLRKNAQPVRRHRTRLPGATPPRPPSSWSAARKTILPPGRWIVSEPKSGPRTRKSRLPG